MAPGISSICGQVVTLSSLAILAALLVASPQTAAAEVLGGARKLLQTTITNDYTAFCSPPRTYSGNFAPGWLFPFTTESDVLLNIDVCGLYKPNLAIPSLPGQYTFTPSITGTFVQTSIPGGRRLTLAVAGTNVFCGAGDEALIYTVSNQTAPGERWLGVGPAAEGFLAYQPPLSLADLQLLTGVATTFNYTLTWEIDDGSAFGAFVNLTYKDIAYNAAKATFVSEEIFLSATGPLRPTQNLHYPLGSLAVINLHQASAADKGGKRSPYLSDVAFNLLAPDARSARAEFLMLEIIPNLSDVSAGVLLDKPVVMPTGGTCDSSSPLPYQCFASDGQSYVCCPAPCTQAEGLVPTCA